MAGSPYSPLKILHHHDRLEQLRKGEQIVPAQVQLIISDLCNQDCAFCAYRTSGYSSNQLFMLDAKPASFGHNNPVRMIPYAKIVEILNDCRDMGVGAIQLTGGGEPSVHPGFTQILEDIHDRGLDLALVSNGVRLSASNIEHLARAKWVRISVDAGTPETYCSVRRVSPVHWKQATDNIRKLAEAKQPGMLLGVGFVVTKDNYLEIVKGTELAKELGADNIRISAVFQNEDSEYFDGAYSDILSQIAEARALADDKFTVFDNFGERYSDLRQKAPDYGFCGFQQFTTYIGGDMNVYRCCVTSYNEQGLIGSLKEQSFRQLWESEAKKQNFASFDARSCQRCMFNNKNRVILYAIDPDPQHVNYV